MARIEVEEGGALEPDEGSIWMVEIAIATPVELDVLAGGEQVLALGASPPTQSIETSVLPVFHQLRVTLVCDEPEEEEAGDASDG